MELLGCAEDQSSTVTEASSPPTARWRPSPLKARHLATGSFASLSASSPAAHEVSWALTYTINEATGCTQLMSNQLAWLGYFQQDQQLGFLGASPAVCCTSASAELPELVALALAKVSACSETPNKESFDAPIYALSKLELTKILRSITYSRYISCKTGTIDAGNSQPI